MAKYKPYTIWTPDWETTSGGIRVMYGLYGWLLTKGFEVHLNVRYDHGVDSVAIYPEIAHGNDLLGKKVVRYILNKPGVMRAFGVPGPSRFDPDDSLYVFSEMFNIVGADDRHHLFLPIINTHLFTDQHKNRTKTAYFVGKGRNLNLHPTDSVLIDRKIANDQGALADLLNECHRLYDYDPVSAMTEVARLCGTQVFLYQSEYSEEEYKKYEPGLNGIIFEGNHGIPLDTSAFRESYIALRRKFEEQLDMFIEDTQ